MSISGSHDAFHLAGDSIASTVNSSGGVVMSTSNFDSQTRLVRIVGLGLVTSTSGIRVKIGLPTDVASSTLAEYIPLYWPTVRKVNPGERVSAVGNDAATTYSIVVTPLDD